MIEVFERGNGWAWRMICAAGRTLVDVGGFASQGAAIDDARRYRADFFTAAQAVDARQGAAI